MRVQTREVRTSLLIVIVGLTVGVLCLSLIDRLELSARPGTGAPQLISIIKPTRAIRLRPASLEDRKQD